MIRKRNIYKELFEQRKERKISLLIGARQVGKTTLLKQLFEEISKKEKCLFLDLDIFSNFEKVSSFENFLNTLKLNNYSEKTKMFYLFLDEFQRYSDLSKIMKNVYDNLKNVKIYASGSSSLKIKSQIQESLAGRKKTNYIYPLDFEEFLEFKGKKKEFEVLKNSKDLKGKNLEKVTNDLFLELKEFMIFGGYPEVILKKTEKEKKEVLESIFDLYIKKDLIEYLKVEKILNVKKLIEYLAINNAQKIKYEEISHVSSLSYKEVIRYLEILKETFLIDIIRPYYKNKNKELTKIPKIYFLDNGVRNYFINNFNNLKIRDDAGFLFEGFVFSELTKEKGIGEVKYWNDKNNREIDFIIEKGGSLKCLEVKYKTKISSNDFIGIKNFKKEYPRAEPYLINLSIQEANDGVNFILPYMVKEIEKMKK